MEAKRQVSVELPDSVILGLTAKLPDASSGMIDINMPGLNPDTTSQEFAKHDTLPSIAVVSTFPLEDGVTRANMKLDRVTEGAVVTSYQYQAMNTTQSSQQEYFPSNAQSSEMKTFVARSSEVSEARDTFSPSSITSADFEQSIPPPRSSILKAPPPKGSSTHVTFSEGLSQPIPSVSPAETRSPLYPPGSNPTPEIPFNFSNQHENTEAKFTSDTPQGYVKLEMGTEKLNDKIQEVSKMIKEEWASSQQRKRKVVKPKKMNLNKVIVKKKKGRYSMEDICVAATILYCSKRVYNYLKNNKLMNLPCIRLVYKRLEKFTCPPGKSPQVMRLLQLKLKTLDEAERFVSISFDEIYLEQKFSYCPRLRQGFKALKVI